MPKPLNITEIKNKMEHYCAYQERCHNDVFFKLKSFFLDDLEIDEVIVHLIQNNFLNEERFARSFARGKHRIKHWGKIRIVNELKIRNISRFNITAALSEISPEEYIETFEATATRLYENLSGENTLKKRKRFYESLLRKGFESHLIQDKIKEFGM